MQRNLDRRVEVVFPVIDPEIRDYLKNEILAGYLKDNVNTSILGPDGTYVPVKLNGSKRFDSQMSFVGVDILA